MEQARLESWRYVAYDDEEGVLLGLIYDDYKRRFCDGKHIRTSLLKSDGNLKEGDIVVTYTGTRYCLGAPRPNDED